jgi:hypothetical protein
VISLPALTSLNLSHCINLKDTGLRAVSSVLALTSLPLCGCNKVTDAGVRALSSLPALTFLELRCFKVTAAGAPQHHRRP